MSSSGSFQITEESSVVKITIGETIKTTGGRNITIYCPTEGTPKPKVLWKYNGKMIELGKRIHIDRENAITIPDVKQWDSGVYACFAGNSFEVVSSKSHLEILRKYFDCHALSVPLLCEINQSLKTNFHRNKNSPGEPCFSKSIRK